MLFTLASAASEPLRPDISNALYEPFFDISHSTYPEAIVFLHEREILNGYEDGTFRPKKLVKRAELTVLLMLEHTNRIFPPLGCFADVNLADWFSPYVCGAKEIGLVSGYPDDSFAPDSTVTYVEALKLVIDTFHLPVDAAKDGEPWYLPYQKAAHQLEVMPIHTYAPRDDLTREAMAQLIYRAIMVSEEITTSMMLAQEPSADVGFVNLQPVDEASLPDALWQRLGLF
ncbi:MAG: S-layer homology domain-containing protein [Deinococcota bacterium]